MHRQIMPIEEVQRGNLFTKAGIMNNIILADSQAIYQAGTIRQLGTDDSCQIVAQCGDRDSMYRAISALPGSLVLFAASLRPDFTRLRMLLDTCGSRGIVIAEGIDSAWEYLEQGFWGVVFRDVSGPSLLECVRRVAAGDTWLPTQPVLFDGSDLDFAGRQVVDRLTRKELRMVPLIILGCTHHDIATRLKTTEQAVMSCLRSISQTIGTTNREELALFAMRHPVLTEAIADLGDEPTVQEFPCSPISPRRASMKQSWGNWGPFNLLASGVCISAPQLLV
jgi:DNA-binding NarL/FixJ family response regulator